MILPSESPEAAKVFSLKFGMCCLKTSGVNFLGPLLLPPPRPGPQPMTALSNRQEHASTQTTRADNFMSAHTAASLTHAQLTPMMHNLLPNKITRKNQKKRTTLADYPRSTRTRIRTEPARPT